MLSPPRAKVGTIMTLPVESNDDAVLRMLSGASFGPNTKITLPSGKQLDGDEAGVFSSLMSPEEIMQRESRRLRKPGFTGPLVSMNDDWDGDLVIDGQTLEQPAIAAVQQPATRRRRWWQFFKR